jgi:hypothetical protein
MTASQPGSGGMALKNFFDPNQGRSLEESIFQSVAETIWRLPMDEVMRLLVAAFLLLVILWVGAIPLDAGRDK